MTYLIIFIILILVFISIFIINFAFKNLVLSPRQTKEQAFDFLEKKQIYTLDKYNSLNTEELKVKSKEGYILRGYFIEKSKDCKKTVIIIHGYTGNHFISLQFADMFLDNDFNVLLIDSRSHGKSDGKYVSYGFYEKEDLDLWVNLIKNKVGENSIIGLMGQSMGASTVLMYGGAYENKVNFIIADCGFSSGKEILKYQLKKVGHIPIFPFYFFINRKLKKRCSFSMDEISPINDIKNTEIPVLFIHGTADKIVPCKMSEDMFDSKKGNKNVFYKVEGAGHVASYFNNKEKYKEQIYNFINLSLNKQKKEMM